MTHLWLKIHSTTLVSWILVVYIAFAKAFVRESVPPDLSEDLPTILETQNSTNRLRASCSFTSTPPANISWTYNSYPLPEHVFTTTATYMELNSTLTETQSVIQWNLHGSKETRSLYSGSLQCHADNGAGITDSKVMQLTMKEAPDYVFRCNFEDNYDPLCGMEQSVVDDIDWNIGDIRSGNWSSGPTVPYNGPKFLIILSQTANNGSNASIMTPALNYSGDVCISLAYHIANSGTTPVGVLAVGIVGNGKTWKNFGDTRNWRVVDIDGSIDVGQRIFFDAIVSMPGVSDTTIDDISVTPGLCSSTAFPDGEVVALPYVCDFEDGWCGMRHKTGVGSGLSYPVWSRYIGPTPNAGTGPENHHHHHQQQH